MTETEREILENQLAIMNVLDVISSYPALGARRHGYLKERIARTEKALQPDKAAA